MRYLLLSLLILALLRTFCEARCWRKPVGKNGCIKHGKLHQVHTVWRTNDCERCECKPEELVCCSQVFTPTNYDKKKCVPMFHKPSCSIHVVKKNNPLEFCKVFAGVG
ncbi:beta-microseminoprotein [Eublepharis macularius]|uniref:Beta-microseminoprotein n=1 Tax=Eublepharis macularius TaxID=481883 RepID=A0AA97JIH4_EUBMA|nr:beta-microseminoprotein [Eublepharis macularius]